MNTAASILRELVGRSFEVNPRQVKLSGFINPDWSEQDSYFDGSMGSSKETVRIWGFSTTERFVELHIVGQNKGSNYAHSTSINRRGTPIHEVDNVERFVFFVVHKEGYDSWQGQEHTEWNDWTIYKAPYFASHITKLTESDIERWQKWVSE